MMFSQILNPVDHHLAGIKKFDKYFPKRPDFMGISFPVKIRDVHQIEKMNSVDISVFGYENKEKHPIYVSKNVAKKNMLSYY